MAGRFASRNFNTLPTTGLSSVHHTNNRVINTYACVRGANTNALFSTTAKVDRLAATSDFTPRRPILDKDDGIV
uniref:Uncharacterized protein n=1 Tax=Oryza nivara TaxID=4536 RepID=A0A0E0HX17_ORYNI